MATAQDAVQRLQIVTSTPGADDATDSMNKLAASMGGVTVASAAVEKTTSSLDSKFASIERRYNDQVKALQDYQKIQNTVNAAVSQNPALQDRANAVLAVAKQRYDDVTGSQSLFQKSLTGVQSQIIALSAGLGPVGTALAALGPIGLAAGAAIGIVEAAFEAMSKRADELASKATGLNNFAAVTGLTTDQVQALSETAGKLGVSSEQTQTFIDSFTSKLTELRTASGPLYDAIVKVDAGIAQQMLTARGTAAELDLYAQAYKEAAAAGNGNALLQAAGGRTGVTQGPVVGAIADAGGLDAMNAGMEQGSRLANSLVLQLKDLKAQNDSLKEDIQNNIASLFSSEILANQVQSRTTMLGLTESLKEFKLSGDWNKFVSDIGTIANADVPSWWKTFYNYVTGVATKSTSLPSSVFSDDFGANFSPSHAAEGPPARAATAGTEDPVATANKYKALETVLGSSATVADQYNAKLAALIVTARAAGVPADQLVGVQNQLTNALNSTGGASSAYGRALSALGLDKAIALQSLHNSALGAAATLDDVLNAKQQSLNKQQQQGAGLTQDQINRQLQITAAQNSGISSINAQNDAEKVKLATVGMSTEAALAYSTAQTEINRQLAAGRPIQDINVDGIKAAADAYAQTSVKAAQYADIQNTLHDSALSFSQSFVQGLMQGKTGMEALSAAATQLSQKLADKALTDLFSGNFIQAGVEAVAAVGSYLFGKGTDDKAAQELQQAKDAWAGMADQVVKFNLAAQGVDLGPLTNELGSLYSTAVQLMQAAAKAEDSAGLQSAADSFNASVNRIVGNFLSASQALSPLQQSIKGVNDEAAGLIATLNEISSTAYDDDKQAITASAQAQIKAIIAQFTDTMVSGLQARLNTANGKDYLNSAQDVLTQHQTDLSSAAELGDSPALMAQIAATFAAEAQKVVNDAGLVGDQFNDFIQLFPDFAGVVTQSATAIQAANDNFAALTKTIDDYLNSLQLGSNSILSPQDQLNTAQSQFNAQLSLAQQGNTDALGSITQYASTLLDQAKGYYASSQGYTDIYSAVTDALKALTTMPTPGLATGGMVPGYANGGMISNGTFGVDSVIAKYAGGGSIALAGGEYVMPAAQTQAHLPMLEAMRSGSGSNDNGQYFAQQTTALSQVFGQVGMAQISAWQNGNAEVCSLLRSMLTELKSNKAKAPRPNAKAAA